MKYNRQMNVFEKLQAGWYWFGECFDEWCYTMIWENRVDELHTIWMKGKDPKKDT